MPTRTKPLNVSLVGAGKVGTTLAVLLHRRGHKISSIISRSLPDARRCAARVRCTTFSTLISDLAPATELLMIATPDEAIRDLSELICRSASLQFRRLRVFHTSGALTSDELQAFAGMGARTFSLHPVQTFPRGISIEQQLAAMKGISYGFEGSREMKPFGSKLARELGGKIFPVPKEEKVLYHLACVFASNYSVALLGAVDDLAAEFIAGPRLQHFRKLIEMSVRSAVRSSPGEALTGPIARGSSKIVALHLEQVRRRKDLDLLYRAIGLYALKLTRRANKISSRQASVLRKILSKGG